jgi:hypothetical protein
MTYLITKMLLCLLFTLLLGLLIGWQLRGFTYRHRDTVLSEELQEANDHLLQTEKERDALFLKLERMEQDNLDLNTRLMNISIPSDDPSTVELENIARRLQKLEEANLALKSRVDGIDSQSGNYPLAEIERLTAEEVALFERVGIDNTQALLEEGATPEGRQDIAARTGIDEAEIHHLTTIADLLRVPGITGSFANLIAATGIESVSHLSEQKPYQFALKLKEINTELQLLPTCPGATTVSQWVDEAAQLQA